MAIIKTKIKTKNYIQIEKTGIEDPRLSWAATGLLTYLIGRPENWNIIIEHLKTIKTDGRDATRNALNVLREFNYCHYFEIREKGKIVETIYLIFENPILSTEAIKEIEVFKGQDIFYKEYKKNNITYPKTENPFTGKSIMEKSFTEKTTLLIKDNIKKINKNNKTTTRIENNQNSKYDFLSTNKYPLLNEITKKNIEKNIEVLTEEEFKKIYDLSIKYINNGKGKNFNAILYQGLKKEWNFNIEIENCIELEENKKKWLSYFAGIIMNKPLKTEIENIISTISIDILNQNKMLLARMNTFEFKKHLLSLRMKN